MEIKLMLLLTLNAENPYSLDCILLLARSDFGTLNK